MVAGAVAVDIDWPTSMQSVAAPAVFVAGEFDTMPRLKTKNQHKQSKYQSVPHVEQ